MYQTPIMTAYYLGTAAATRMSFAKEIGRYVPTPLYFVPIIQALAPWAHLILITIVCFIAQAALLICFVSLVEQLVILTKTVNISTFALTLTSAAHREAYALALEDNY